MGKKDFFDDEDKKRIQADYESLINNLLRCNKPGDREMIDKAFRIANEAHWNMRRKSGEPYIIHPIAVAKIVNQEIGLGAKSITAALLMMFEDTVIHDNKEDFDQDRHLIADLQKSQEHTIKKHHQVFRQKISGRCF